MWAEGTAVMRFIPIVGAESEVQLNTLRKVVFTADKVVLITAEDGTEIPLYKYDYKAIEFGESGSQEGLQVTGDGLPGNGEKFIQDGRLYIRKDGKVYDVMGRKI